MCPWEWGQLTPTPFSYCFRVFTKAKQKTVMEMIEGVLSQAGR